MSRVSSVQLNRYQNNTFRCLVLSEQNSKMTNLQWYVKNNSSKSLNSEAASNNFLIYSFCSINDLNDGSIIKVVAGYFSLDSLTGYSTYHLTLISQKGKLNQNPYKYVLYCTEAGEYHVLLLLFHLMWDLGVNKIWHVVIIICHSNCCLSRLLCMCVFRPGEDCRQPWGSASSSQKEDCCDDHG